MGLYKRKDSPFFWMWIEGVGPRSTGVPHDGGTPARSKQLRAQAQDVYSAAKGDVAREKFKLPVKRAGIAFEKWAEWYDPHVIATHGGAERERELLAHLRSFFGADLLADITRTRAAEYLKARIDAGASRRTANREVDLLKAMLRAAVEHKKIDSSPLVGMPRLKVVKPKRRLMTPAEERKLLKALRMPEGKAIVLLGLDSLVRLGDLLDFRRDDDYGDHGIIRAPKAAGDSEPYAFPISHRGRKALDRIPKRGPYYFARWRQGKTDRARRAVVTHMLRRACERAGIDYGRKVGGITFHWATRRTGARRMLERGADLAAVQRVGNWKRADVLLELYGEVEALSPATRRAVELPGRRPRHLRETAATSERRRKRA